MSGTRQMQWADIVPLGYFATWGCEPNPGIEELRALVERFGPDHTHLWSGVEPEAYCLGCLITRQQCTWAWQLFE